MTLTWGTQQDWEDASKTDIAVVNDTVELAGAAAIIDDFDDGSTTEYSAVAGSIAENTNSPVYEGTRSAKVTKDNGGFAQILSVPGDGLSNYPDFYGTYRINWSIDTTSETGLQFFYGTQSNSNTDNTYFCYARTDSTDFSINKFDGGSYSQVKQTSWSPSANTEYILELDWQSDGSITQRILDPSDESEIASVAGTDNTHSPHGFGLGCNSDGGAITAVYDNFRKI